MSEERETLSQILHTLNQLVEGIDRLGNQVGVPQLLTLAQVAEATGLSIDSIRRKCDRRELRYIQDGPNAAKRIALDDLKKWIDRNSVAPLRKPA